MKQTSFILIAIISICFCSCAKYSLSYTHKLARPANGTNPKELTYSDSLIKASFAFTDYYSRLNVSVTNLSADAPLYVLKDQCVMIVNKSAKQLCSLSPQRVDCETTHPPLLVPPNANYTDVVTPIDNIKFEKEKDRYTHVETTTWKTYPLMDIICGASEDALQMAKQKAQDSPISYVLSFTYKGITYQRTFEFEVDSIRAKDL